MRQDRPVLNSLRILCAGIAVILSLAAPEFTDSIRYAVLLIAMITVGIPHGAIDHLVGFRPYAESDRISGSLTFYLLYLALILLMGAIWYIDSVLGFILFALVTIYHFGQADLSHLEMSTGRAKLLYVSRGAMILGLITLPDLTFTGSVIESATRLRISGLPALNTYSTHLAALLVLQHLLLYTLLIYRSGGLRRPRYIYQAADILVVATLFFGSDPVIAFSIYFALWHSMGHIHELTTYFGRMGKELTVGEFYRLSMPFTAVSIVGLLILFVLDGVAGEKIRMVSLLFILISVLTLPHALVVERMFRSDGISPIDSGT